MHIHRIGRGTACKRVCPRFGRSTAFMLALFALAISQLFATDAALCQSSTALSPSTALYPRAIRLSHNAVAANNGEVVVSVTAFPNNVGEEDIYASASGTSFQKIGAITDPDFAGGLCCGTLFELPIQLGTLNPGTLLWAGSVGQTSKTQPMQLKVFQSSDAGKTWSYLSSCATGQNPGTTSGGLWEPQFTIAADGALVCFYSDETQTGHSQVLRQVRTYNGSSWQDVTNTVASAVQADRPGMAVVTKLPSGTYFMSYEICGTAACTVFSRTSSDGWNWGDPASLGTKVVTTSGQWFEHAPTNVWAPSATSSNGTILLVGQMLYESSGAISSGSGATTFTNHTADGSGPWSTMSAPVQVSNVYDNYCPNYSSALLPSTDGMSVLELASQYVGSVCTMFYSTGPIIAGTQTATVKVTPESASIETNQAVKVDVAISGIVGGPGPSGTVTVLGSGNYSSGAVSLVNGAATITIPANSLPSGADTLTVNYSGDANYAPSTGSGTIRVTSPPTPTFALSGSGISLTAGATTGNVIVITVTPAGGFTGNVDLSAQITAGPGTSLSYYPTLSFGASSPVTITGSSAAAANLTVSTVAATQSSAKDGSRRSGASANLAFALAGLFPVGVVAVRRRIQRAAGLFLVIGALMLVPVGCGGGQKTSSVVGTPLGSYSIVVTGTGATSTASEQIVLTVQ